jgi:hypothetical protein
MKVVLEAIALLVLALTGCDMTGPARAYAPIDSLVVVGVGGPPCMMPICTSEPLYLYFRTSREYPANSYQIGYSISKKLQRWDITLRGVYDAGREALWPGNVAIADVLIGTPEDGVYSLSLQVNARVTVGLLFVEPDCYRIEIPDTTDFQIGNASSVRIPGL